LLRVLCFIKCWIISCSSTNLSRTTASVLHPVFVFRDFFLSKFNFLENSSSLFEFYLDLCKKLGLGDPISDKKPIYPYNILITNKWIAIIKRKNDHIHGFSINGLGFAGYLLVTEKSNINYLKKFGPEKLLESFV